MIHYTNIARRLAVTIAPCAGSHHPARRRQLPPSHAPAVTTQPCAGSHLPARRRQPPPSHARQTPFRQAPAVRIIFKTLRQMSFLIAQPLIRASYTWTVPQRASMRVLHCDFHPGNRSTIQSIICAIRKLYFPPLI